MSSVGETASGPVVDVRRGRSTGWWGMMGLIATESMLFALLIFTYFYFRAGLGLWPPEGLPLPGLKSVGIRSIILLGSSLPVIWAEHALEERGDRTKTAVWSFVALAMSAVFLTGHIQEQFALFDELAPLDTAYGTTFVTILNFHAAHLIIGMLIMGFVLVHLLRGRITQRRHGLYQVAAMYWHFVDVIWIVVFSTLYLSPHVLRN